MDDLAALRLQVEWGADEALLAEPADRFGPASLAAPATAAVLPPVPRQPAATVVPLLPGPALAAAAAAAAPDFAALHAALDGFNACPLRATASHTVAPSGNPASGLVLLAEAPGPEDDRAGRAFSGAAGDRLDRILASAGLGRDNLMLAMIVPWRPPGGRPVSEAELAMCLPFLHRLLVLAHPVRLVLMGAGPYRALGGEDGGFRRARGKSGQSAVPGITTPVRTLTTLAPEMWLSSPANKQALWSDLLSLRESLTLS